VYYFTETNEERIYYRLLDHYVPLGMEMKIVERVVRETQYDGMLHETSEMNVTKNCSPSIFTEEFCRQILDFKVKTKQREGTECKY
jgi:hypothetical protein